ncbi:hypothetical protein PGT21_033992 [Puccinia graminis f. sp. tritici]|uniref:Uncharacterized protein n=1 Tax=Puccinia graminis f. sp. tritici TaxID=56615 RepID=A0A5B0PBA1_PUCGR|nr:hypothetical protein PGT21_033992 [Puccinia graminis f. sp. tritici]KAA1125622.1 hypothetical protein PGTUg99_012592 [Puccinia graminis f. sp. tritici]
MLLSLKSIIVVTLLAFDLAAATLEEDKKKQCTFTCPTSTIGREAGCARATGWKSDNAVKFEIVKANPTENHKDFFNCHGTGMAFSTCCVRGTIKIPSKGKPMILDSGTPQNYEKSCTNTDPEKMHVENFPKDCKPPK